MQVNWTGYDYAVAAIFIAALSLTLVVGRRAIANPRRRLVFTVLVLVGFALLWVDGAVGIIGD